jgi:hypothetical protein
MAIDIPVAEFIEDIGHDGGAEPYSSLDTKAGFHEQECIDVLQRRGFACTPVEIVPQMVPFERGPARQIWFGGQRPGLSPEDCNWERFLTHLQGTCGVLTGVKKKINSNSFIGHAVAWFDGMIHDPQGSGYIYSIDDAPNYGYIPRAYWKIQEVTNG